MKCFEVEVEWWQILNGKNHLYLGKSKCKEVIDNLYIQYEDGTKEPISAELLNETLWRFELIPQSMYKDIIKLINDANKLELLKIHNQFLLSGEIICCQDIDIISNFKAFFKYYER